MTGVLQRLPAGSAVTVIRLRSLGDCVLTTPALHLLKQARPDLRIGVVVDDRFAAVYDGNPDIDAVLPPQLKAVRRWRGRLCLNLHGGTRSMGLAAASGAKLRAGFEHFRGGTVYNVRIPTAQEILGVDRKVHTAEHVASAMFYLGVPRTEIPRARLYAPSLPAAKPYAIIHPVAATPEKTWPAERFLQVARSLDLEAVFIGGPEDDLSPFAAHRLACGQSLRESMSLIAGASLFIGNDSGPAHVAAAYGVPAVVLFGPSDPVVWAPWRTESQVLSADPITGISVEQVAAAAERLSKVAR